MRDRSSKIDKWVRSDEDFKEMNWHDVVIHGLATNNEMLSGPDEEPRFEPQKLLFDIDYVLNWRESNAERRADFWVSPATLVFEEVSNLNVNFGCKSGKPLLVIYAIGREGRRWTISLEGGGKSPLIQQDSSNTSEENRSSNHISPTSAIRSAVGSPSDACMTKARRVRLLVD